MRLRLSFMAVGLVALLAAGAANALSISYYLDQNNNTTTTDPDGALPDGTNYLMVTLADNGDDIDITVDILTPLTDIKDANFGIHTFFFNSTNALSGANISGLGDWTASIDQDGSPPHLTGDGFGRFDVKLAAGTRQDPTLSFSITGVVGDSPSDYVVLSTASAEGDTYFAAQVAGFEDQNSLDWPLGDPPDDVGLCQVDGEGNYTPECNILTSAWFGGTTVPEPSTALLLLGGLSGLVVWGRRRLH